MLGAVRGMGTDEQDTGRALWEHTDLPASLLAPAHRHLARDTNTSFRAPRRARSVAAPGTGVGVVGEQEQGLSFQSACLVGQNKQEVIGQCAML